MIRIGNQTSAWAPTPTEPFDYAVANGFDAFEWFPDKKPGVGWDDSDLDASQRLRIREVAGEKVIRLSVHARWQANPLHPESRELLQKEVQLAKDLGAVLLNIHLYHEAGLERYISAITPLIEQTAEAGMQLSIENTPEHSPEQFNELFGSLRNLGSIPIGHIGMCLDLGHANLSSATRNDYLAFMDRLNKDLPIIHLHLHENWGDGDTHLTLFTGPAGRDDSGVRGFMRRIQKRGFSGSIIFEQWPQPPSLLNQAREKLLGLVGDKNKTCGKKDGGEARASSAESGAVGTPRPTSVVEVERAIPTAPQEMKVSENRNFFDSLVVADKQARSWREKLDAIRDLIVGQGSEIGDEELASVAIYLRFLSAGQIACEEDGRHFRPSHHARIAEEIRERLGKVSKPENAQLLRKIYAALPSSAQDFQRAEPLTRIRDIAHRNDIPSDLKQEIKTTLQNKLHRCAGPEDLATSSALLERITAPEANYSPEFVEQFKIFHEELKEFFNAKSLDEQLTALARNASDEQRDLIQGFLKQKAEAGFANQLKALNSVTTLRRLFTAMVHESDTAVAQQHLLADIGLEDFAFVLLSQMINEFEAESSRSGVDLLEPFKLVIRNFAMSGISVDECAAISSELDAWTQHFNPGEREQLLRLKATIERARRLAESYSDEVIALLLSRAEKLGRALGVPEHAIRVFCEAEIRSHLVFQLSKLASLLLQRLRKALNLPGWDVLVGGEARGRVKLLGHLEEVSENGAEPVIAVLKRAGGEEEIPKAVKGILVAHEIPHLSHLGVRARQAGVVFVGTEDPASFEEIEKFAGQTIRLQAGPDRMQWEKAQASPEGVEDHPNAERAGEKRITPVVLRDGSPLILPLREATVETCGQKAFGLRKLTELVLDKDDSFSVPAALVIPFGVMELVLAATGNFRAQYQRLAQELDGAPGEKLESKVNDLRKLLEQIDLPQEIASAIAKTFQKDNWLIIRSSANCEDLEDFAGAGLYESIPRVAPGDASMAVRRVWASLWTRRAVLSRRQARIAHESAQMAVIIQQMIEPGYSFILHTVNPLTHNADEIYAEVAVGLGETLASASTRGTPYRFICNKKSGEVQTLAFANFSHAARGDSNNGVTQELLDYSKVGLSSDSELRREFGRRLAAVGSRIENVFGNAQDIEGAIVESKIYLVQSRVQQGL